MPLRNNRHAQDSGGRAAPQGMPREVTSQSRAPRQIEQKRDVLPEQKPITDDGEQQKPPSKIRIFFKRLGLGLLLLLALSLAYIFLLLGEPEPMEEMPQTAIQEEVIHVPMAAVESEGVTDISTVAAAFGKPVLALYGDPFPLQKSTLSDTAFQGGYARRAALSYALPDGQILKLESIRPTAAVSLLKQPGSSLYMFDIYNLAGMDAARMDNPDTVCLFAQNTEAVYAITCPASQVEELWAVLRQTTLWSPNTAP